MATVANVQQYTPYDTNKNRDVTSASIVVPSTLYAAGAYLKYSTTVTLVNSVGTKQILTSFSTDATKYYAGNFIVFALDANFQVQIRTSVSATTLTIDCYVINQTGGAVSNTAFTSSHTVKRFVPPF